MIMEILRVNTARQLATPLPLVRFLAWGTIRTNA